MDGSDAGSSGPAPSPEMAGLSDEQLIGRIRDLEEARRTGRQQTGQMLAELYRRGRLSWPAIAAKTGIRQTTAYELAERYNIADDGIERPPTPPAR